jgi:hypothetical protein
MKTCSKCNKEKTRSEFYKRKASKDGLNPWCKECHVGSNLQWAADNPDFVKQKKSEYYYKYHDRVRNKELKHKFGITLEEYNSMLEFQLGVCAICQQPEISRGRGGKIRPLAVDHNHKTNKNRGLLCHTCNSALGLFKDNTDLLEKAIKYLLHHSFCEGKGVTS